ncbi:MAG: formylglycine-generating enzyme family protein [Chloroflexi bacterium]|nr:formylglycine-generating enzyme family protein [Chloroflexota bacterium]
MSNKFMVPFLCVALLLIALGLMAVGLLAAPSSGAVARAAQDETPTPEPELEPDAESPPVPTIESNDEWEPVIEVFNEAEMVLVPPGCFDMGADEGENSDLDEKPVHQQCFEEPFWIDRNEVTRAMYATCVEDGGCTEATESLFSVRDEQPMNMVTWFQATEYCEWRGTRLPTELEWEYAARGPSNLRYPWGDTFDIDLVVVSGWATEPADVGSIPEGASWVGALDMGGNLWEWTTSIYKFYPYDPAEFEDPENTTSARVWRGGSFRYDDDVRGANRDAVSPTRVDEEVGIRCVSDYILDTE